MDDEFIFHPERRSGFAFQTGMILVFTLSGLLGILLAAQASIGPTFLLALIPILIAAAGVPLMVYRFYGLRNARYVLQREGMLLRWGLRQEEIPIDRILWVHCAEDLHVSLALPRLRWPGAVVGLRRMPRRTHEKRRSMGEESLEIFPVGEVEFLAADVKRLVLVATPERIFALSPSNPNAFVSAFHRCTEMGSLSPIHGQSMYPAFLLGRMWSSRAARALALAGGTVSLLLLTWVSLAIPGREQIVLGLQPGFGFGAIPGGSAVPAVQLLLLPVINLLFFAIDFFVGLFFFRKPESKPLAYLLWGASAVTGVAFLAATWFILSVS